MAVASKSMVESSMLSSKEDSIDSMVPEPFSEADTPPVQLAMFPLSKKTEGGRRHFFQYRGCFCALDRIGVVFFEVPQFGTLTE